MIELIDPIDDADLDYLERTLRRPGSTHRQPRGTMLSAVIRLRRDEILMEQLGCSLQNVLSLLYEGVVAGSADDVDAVIAEADGLLADLGNWNQPGVSGPLISAIAKIDDERRRKLGMGLVPVR